MPAGDPLKYVKAGDSLRSLSATTFNTLIDGERQRRAQRPMGGAPAASGPAGPEPYTLIYVKNNSGASCARFGVLGIDGIVFGPADNLPEFQNRPCLSGVTPTTADHAGGKFVVLAEPLAIGNVGKAFIGGACVVQVDITDEAHRFADVKGGDETQLASGSNGAQILYKEAGTGTKWALVKFGGVGSNLPIPTALYQVLSCTSFTSASVYTVAFDWVRASP